MTYVPKAKRRPLALKRKVQTTTVKIEIAVSQKAAFDALAERAERVGAEIDMKDLYLGLFAEALSTLEMQIEELENGESDAPEPRRRRRAVDAQPAEPDLATEPGPIANGAISGDAAIQQPHASNHEL